MDRMVKNNYNTHGLINYWNTRNKYGLRYIKSKFIQQPKKRKRKKVSLKKLIGSEFTNP